MPACPAGHESSASDFCDVCGMRIGAPAGSPAGDRPAVRRPVPVRVEREEFIFEKIVWS